MQHGLLLGWGTVHPIPRSLSSHAAWPASRLGDSASDRRSLLTDRGSRPRGAVGRARAGRARLPPHASRPAAFTPPAAAPQRLLLPEIRLQLGDHRVVAPLLLHTPVLRLLRLRHLPHVSHVPAGQRVAAALASAVAAVLAAPLRRGGLLACRA